jgi:hypothetical protein
MNRAALDAVTRRIQIVSSALCARGGTSGKAQQRFPREPRIAPQTGFLMCL